MPALSTVPPLGAARRWRPGDPRDVLLAQAAWVAVQTATALTTWTSALWLGFSSWLGLCAAMAVLAHRPARAPFQRLGLWVLAPLAVVGVAVGQRLGLLLVGNATGVVNAMLFALVTSLVASSVLILATFESHRAERLPGEARLAHLPTGLRAAIAEAREATALLGETDAAELAHALAVEVLRTAWRIAWTDERLQRVGAGGERVSALRAELEADRRAREAGLQIAQEALRELCLSHALGTLDHALPLLVARARSTAEARGAVARAAREVGW